MTDSVVGCDTADRRRRGWPSTRGGETLDERLLARGERGRARGTPASCWPRSRRWSSGRADGGASTRSRSGSAPARSPACGSGWRRPGRSPRRSTSRSSPVGTLAALARGIVERSGRAGRRALAVLDARRGQVFAALYGRDGRSSGRRSSPPPASSPGGLRRWPTPPVAAGSGALRFRAELEAAGAEILAGSRVGAPGLGASGLPARPRPGSRRRPSRFDRSI